MRIYLTGYMASGKSNLGRQLADILGFSFIDIDQLFEERYRVSVLDFFEKYDEVAFRNLERALLHETIEMDNVVVSTGGGTPCFFDNMEFIKRAGVSVYLEMEVSKLTARLLTVKRKRPLLKDIPPAELENRIAGQLEQRRQFYCQADLTINGEGVDAEFLVKLIMQQFRQS